MHHKPILTATVLCLLSFAGAFPGAAIADEMLVDRPVHQLRIYHIEGSNRQAFHERFRGHAARIMETYGFDIVAMWESELGDRLEFVYLLEWPDVETMRRQWSAFMDDEEWARIKRETGAVHGTFVHDIEDRTLHLTRYSPQP